MEYRKDVQMLRGVAVSLVVFYHLGVAGFNSGFLGVDVFFVISGYLMALLYDPGKKTEFFVKRARRLFPSYFATVAIALIVAALVTAPSDYGQVSIQSIFAAFFVSNIGFWTENSYFDRTAFKPLLHLWSLGVEIQFYVLIPIIYWFVRKFRVGFLLLMLGSAILCFLIINISPKTSFFWLPLRLWEFLVGFGVAKYIYKATTTETFAWVGLAALVLVICISFIPVEGQSLGFTHGHPGLAALLISFSTGITIAFGIPLKVQNNLVSNALVQIGNYSYSIYLAHFPIIVLFLYQPLSGTLLKAQSVGQMIGVAALVLAGSWLLHHLIEQPGRRLNNRILGVGCAASFALVLGGGQLGPLVQKSLVPPNEILIYEAWNDRDTYRCGKLQRITHPFLISCETTEPIKAPSHRILLVGNSHADSIKSTFASVAQKKNVSVYFMVENDPLMNSNNITPAGVIVEAKVRNAEAIVLHYSPGALNLNTIEQLAILANENGIRIGFIMPVPVWDISIPTALIRQLKNGDALPSQSIDDYRIANKELSVGLSKISKIKVYQVADVLCKSGCMVISDNGRPLYFDEGHLTLSGSRLLGVVFDRLITDL